MEHQVRRFYDDVWNRWDEAAARELLNPDISFRGSLGVEAKGVEEFFAYQRRIRDAFPDFQNEIEELVVAGERAAARLLYTGTHRGEALGIAPTGRSIAYRGAAFFTGEGERIVRVWVLGDLEDLRRQLTGAGPSGSTRCQPVGPAQA